jgi:hypothetical protein
MATAPGAIRSKDFNPKADAELMTHRQQFRRLSRQKYHCQRGIFIFSWVRQFDRPSMRRTAVEYEHCVQKRGAGQTVKVGTGRKTSRSLRKRGVGQNIKVDGGWDGGRRCGGAAEVVDDARWGERPPRSLRRREVGQNIKVDGGRNGRGRWRVDRGRTVTRGRTVSRGAWCRQHLDDDMR